MSLKNAQFSSPYSFWQSEARVVGRYFFSTTSANCDQSQAGAAKGGDARHPKWVLVACILASSLAFLDGSVVNVALPALRMRSLYLALMTMAFALLLEQVVYGNNAIFSSFVPFATGSASADRPPGLESDRAFFVFIAVCFGLVAIGLTAIRNGHFGRRLAAMKDSPSACATLGLDLTATKLQVFALSAGIAGLGAAWRLQQQGYAVTLFEANGYAGGHTHTVDVTLDGVTHPVDTGFLVFNERTYPLLTALFDELGVRFDSSASEATAAAMLAASINYPIRGAVTWKSTVGTNVASDALSNLASAGVTGGALIVLGEDYGEGASIMQEPRTPVSSASISVWPG